nr:type II toxin-antitoxin system RelE/ParE family toxin [Paenibacillus forsythiae]
MTAIRLDPSIGEQKTGDLAGVYGSGVSYQGTNYEIAYRLEENEEGELIVVILPEDSPQAFFVFIRRELGLQLPIVDYAVHWMEKRR